MCKKNLILIVLQNLAKTLVFESLHFKQQLFSQQHHCGQ